MADWSVMDRDWSFNHFDPFQFNPNQYNPENPEAPPCQPPAMPPPPPPPPPPPAQPYLPPPPTSLAALLYQEPSTSRGLQYAVPQPQPPPKGDNPREIRNKAEKQRRDKLNQSIGELASMVPPVVTASRKIDKTGVLRLTAHYLRAHQYVFGDAIAEGDQQFSAMSTRALLSLLNGFLLTTTYRGLIVVISQNVQQYLGYNEVDLLGQSIFNIIHEEDRQLMRDQLMPKSTMLGPNGELLVPDEPEGKRQVAEILANEKRRFIIRFKKLGQRSEPSQYVTCHIEGSLRKSDRACRGYNRCCQMVRRARARGDNPCSSGNDVVFVGIVRLATETFITESNMEFYRMEYRTRHSIDGQIIETEQRISLVTGYMTHEVNGVNAMNFMHRDDVRWVVIALREMYDQHRLVGESCYRLMAKNGQFIYLKTRGRLELNRNTRAVTSFVCTNTVVDEHEGKHLIRLMKKKFMLMVNNNEEPVPEIEESKEANDQSLAVEDPRQLEKVILHLVTNLPSPQSEEDFQGEAADCSVPPDARLAIIPPRKERIVSAIEKIYSVIKTFPNKKISAPKIQTLENIQESEIMAYRRKSNRTPKRSSDRQAPLPKLPTFNDVYQRRHTEAPGMLQELNIYSANNSMRNNGAGTSLSSRATATITKSESEMPSSSFSGLATITSPVSGLTSNNNMPTATTSGMPTATVKYHLYVAPIPNPVQPEPVQVVDVALPGVSGIAGVKRPMEYTNLEVPCKKKPTESQFKAPEELADNDDSLLDTSFLDDAPITFSQIESAMNTLDQGDPSFPDLLVSQEVEDILHEIEKAPQNN